MNTFLFIALAFWAVTGLVGAILATEDRATLNAAQWTLVFLVGGPAVQVILAGYWLFLCGGHLLSIMLEKLE